jgi:hypothetical protein
MRSGLWALGRLIGADHKLGVKHLPAYLDEAAFGWNYRGAVRYFVGFANIAERPSATAAATRPTRTNPTTAPRPLRPMRLPPCVDIAGRNIGIR